MKCLKCELPKSITDFPTDPSGRPRAYCNDCFSQLQLEEEVKGTKTFFVSQGETCPICLNKMPYGVVDRSHEMGHICGIICQDCNALLGKLRGNHKLIDEAIAKLQRAKQYLLYSREDHELKIYLNNKPHTDPGWCETIVIELRTYLNANSIDYREAAREICCKRQMVWSWVNGTIPIHSNCVKIRHYLNSKGVIC